jgi:hypothetical protein
MTPLPSTVIIGLGYKAKMGKDTAVNAILEARGGQYDIRRYAFADTLREEVDAAMFDNWVHHSEKNGEIVFDAPSPLRLAENLCDKVGVPFDPNAQIEPGYPFTKQRALYQWWGTEYRRAADPFYWLNKLRARIERDRPKIALITDVRFRNEVTYIRSFEGYTVKVERAGYDNGLTSSQTKHVSEVELDSAPADIWTHNLVTQEGDIEGAKRAAVELFDGIMTSLTFPLMDQILAHPEAYGAVTL